MHATHTIPQVDVDGVSEHDFSVLSAPRRLARVLTAAVQPQARLRSRLTRDRSRAGVRIDRVPVPHAPHTRGRVQPTLPRA